MPACRVNSFSNSWFLVSSQAVNASQMCERRNHVSSRTTDLTVHAKAHRPNQHALSKPAPALNCTSTCENKITSLFLSNSQTQKYLSHSLLLTSGQTRKSRDPEIVPFTFASIPQSMPPSCRIKKLPQIYTGPSAGQSVSISVISQFLPVCASITTSLSSWSPSLWTGRHLCLIYWDHDVELS